MIINLKQVITIQNLSVNVKVSAPLQAVCDTYDIQISPIARNRKTMKAKHDIDRRLMCWVYKNRL